MLTLMQAGVLGALQGISELFPVSSLGHSVILPAVLGWQINEQDPYFLMFLVATHLATAVILFLFFWKDWLRILIGLGRSIQKRSLGGSGPDAKLGWLLIIGTIPAGLLGLIFQNKIQQIFVSPRSAAVFLTLNGLLLFFAERLRRSRMRAASGGDARIAELSWGQGLLVGTTQVIALIPGFSRTGASLAGGLMAGLSHEDALRFSFLLATPIIGAAAALKIPQLLKTGDHTLVMTALVGSIFAAVFAFISVKFLTRYFRTEHHSLVPFALYCIAAGVAASIYLF